MNCAPRRISKVPRHRHCLALIATLLWVFSASSSEAATKDESWSSLLQEGNKALAAQHPAQAEKLFRQAAEAAKRQKDPDSVDSCLLKCASALALLDRVEEARATARQVLTKLTRGNGAQSTKVVPVLMTLGSIEESAGNHSVAMDYYNRALKISEKSYGPYSPVAAGALQGLGRVYGKTGRKEEAKTHLKRAITILSKDPNGDAVDQLKGAVNDYGDLFKGTDNSNRDLIQDFDRDVLKDPDDDSGTTDSKSSTSDSWDDTGSSRIQPPTQKQQEQQTSSQWQKQSRFQLKAQRSEATDENQQVQLRGFRAPASDTTLAPAYKIVNDTIFSQNHYGMGEEQYKRKIATDLDALGPHHPSVGNDLNSLAQLYISQKKFTLAEPLLVRALAVYNQAYGPGNLLTINTNAALASVEFELGNLDKAKELYGNALNQANTSLGPNSLETARILNGLAYLYYQKGQLEESRTFYQWAVASTQQAVGEDDPLLAACLKDYAQVLRSLGRSDEASQMELRAGKISEN